MGKNISYRQLVADKMKGYDFESCEIADTIKTAKDTAREYTSKIKAAASVEERKVLETNTSAEVKNLADALANFEFWQNALNERMHEFAAAQIDDTLAAAVREYGMRTNESWLTKVSLAKLGISYTDSLCDTESRCMSALCDTLVKLYDCKKTIDAAKANKRLIHSNAAARLKKMRDHYNVKITYSLAKAILTEEINLIVG